MDEGVDVADSESADDAEEDGDTPVKRIPVAADFLIAYATAPGMPLNMIPFFAYQVILCSSVREM